MAKRGGGIGWLVAIGLAIGWWNSGSEKPSTPPRPPPVSSSKPTTEAPAIVPAALTIPEAPAAPSPEPQVAERTMFTTANVRLRSLPSTNSEIVWTAPAGTRVSATDIENGWHRVAAAGYGGWMHGDYLSNNQPIARPVQPAMRAVSQAPARVSGSPMRSPYVGTCDCPYDMMRNGRRCGGNSAYSRPGGRNPACYH